MPTTPPPAAVTVTRAPGSPVPVATVPSAPTAITGAAGAVRSGAVTAAAGEALPAASTWTTLSRSPFACGGASGAVKLPFTPTVTVATTPTPGAVTVTRAPASPMPEIVAPSSAIVTTGAGGAVRSGATVRTGKPPAPDASTCVAVSTSPFTWRGVSATV